MTDHETLAALDFDPAPETPARYVDRLASDVLVSLARLEAECTADRDRAAVLLAEAEAEHLAADDEPSRRLWHSRARLARGTLEATAARLVSIHDRRARTVRALIVAAQDAAAVEAYAARRT